MEQVPRWLSPKEKHPLHAAACVAAMIRLRLQRIKNARIAANWSVRIICAMPAAIITAAKWLRSP